MAAAAAIDVSPASADWTITGSCVGGWRMGSCVVHKNDNPRDPHVRYIHGAPNPGAPSDVEIRQSEERDRKWLAYCKPVLIKDRYGVERYHYAKPGCEFGHSGN